MYGTHDDIGSHIVGIIPPHALEIGNVAQVQQDAEQRPGTQHGSPARGWPIEPEYADDGVVQAVHDTGSGAEVVELLGCGEVTGMEDGTEDPGGDTEVSEALIVGTEGVVGRDGGANLFETLPMCPQVPE